MADTYRVVVKNTQFPFPSQTIGYGLSFGEAQRLADEHFRSQDPDSDWPDVAEIEEEMPNG